MRRHLVVHANWSVLVLALLFLGSAATPAVAGGPDQGQGAPPFEPADPAATRIEFIPTARMLGRGEISLRFFGPFPVAQIGLTDRVSFGGAPLYKGALVLPKVQVYDSSRTQVAVGTYHFGWNREWGGLAYAVATHGSEDASFTFGPAWAYEGVVDDWRAVPLFLVGGERRLTSRFKVIGEAFVHPDAVMGSFGLRYIRARGVVEFGAFVLGADGDMAVLPMLSFSFRF